MIFKRNEVIVSGKLRRILRAGDNWMELTGKEGRPIGAMIAGASRHEVCTAIGNLDHSLNQDCDTIQSH